MIVAIAVVAAFVSIIFAIVNVMLGIQQRGNWFWPPLWKHPWPVYIGTHPWHLCRHHSWLRFFCWFPFRLGRDHASHWWEMKIGPVYLAWRTS